MKRSNLGVLVFSSLVLSGCMPAAEPALHGQGVDRVAYVAFMPGNWDIYHFENPEQAPHRLTDHPALDYNPVFSPDGRWVVFCSERSGNPDLFVLDLERDAVPRLLIESNALEDQATISPDGSQLVFVSTRDGNADLYILPFRPDQTQAIDDAKNLTQHPGGDFRPSFSPDGARIAFSSDRDTPVDNSNPIARMRSGDIYVLNLADGALERLTDTPGWDGSPSWSDDGKRIVFYSQREAELNGFGSNSFIWIMNADGSSQRIVSPVDSVAVSPSFTPDGRITYANRYLEEGRPRWEIISINTDGSARRVEQHTTTDYWEPSFNVRTKTMLVHGTGPAAEDALDDSAIPERYFLGEGTLVAGGAPFRRKLPDRDIDLYPLRTFTAMIHPHADLLLYSSPPGPSMYLSKLDGSDEKEMLKFDPPQAPFVGFSWSKDGKWISFTRGNHFSPVDAEADIWKMRVDGSDAINLTPDSPGNDGFPSFSGDGRFITFRSGRTGNFDIFLMNADGSGVRNLTNDPASDLFPAFSPTENRIAFVSDRDSLGSRIYEVYVLDLNENGDPGNLQRVTHNDVQEGHMEFSHDGEWIIFTSGQAGISDEEPLVKTVLFAPQMYGELYAYHLEDGHKVRLTHNKWEDGFSSWGAPLP